MRLALLLAAPALLACASASAAPVEVTRFHTSRTLEQLAPGWLTVVPAPGIDGTSLENRVWLEAVVRALARHGFAASDAGAARIAEVRLTRDVAESGYSRGSGASVGIGVGSGWGGGWNRHGGSHLGLGVGFGLGGSGRGSMVESELSVVIRDAVTRAPLWEGRAIARIRARSRDADPVRVAERLAEALFTGFPGRSGETIEVR